LECVALDCVRADRILQQSDRIMNQWEERVRKFTAPARAQDKLTLVKGMAEAHGGKASVASSEEDGTTFSVAIPRD
jgi:light-regulated signal transduction histidine kinase (bacteriophytochrome)